VKLKLLGTAAALVLLVMLGVAYSLRLDPEIAQANEALHAATSWRVSLEMHPASGAGLWGKVAVVCPDREDLELTGAQAGHTIRVGDQWWQPSSQGHGHHGGAENSMQMVLTNRS